MVRRVSSEDPGPTWIALRILSEQVERLVAANLFWSLQLLPALMGLAFSGWPLVLRTALVGYSAVAVVPATLVSYALGRHACDGEEVSLEAAGGALRALTVPSFRSLAPLCLLLGLLVWTFVSVPLPVTLDVTLRLLALLLSVTAIYWGPLLVDAPQLTPLALLRRSSALFWAYPGRTLQTAAASLAALVVAAVSVGGLFLVALVLLALFQTQAYLSIEGRRENDGNAL